MLTKKYDYNAKYTNNSSGVRGVSYDKAKRKWEAKVQQAGKRIRVGFFDNIKDANDARAAFLAQSTGQLQHMEAARRLSKAAPDLLAALEGLLEDALAIGLQDTDRSGSIIAARNAITNAKGA